MEGAALLDASTTRRGCLYFLRPEDHFALGVREEKWKASSMREGGAELYDLPRIRTRSTTSPNAAAPLVADASASRRGPCQQAARRDASGVVTAVALSAPQRFKRQPG